MCLPTGTKCAATGWGVTDKFATQIPDELNEVGVKIIEKDICENIHPDYHNQLSDEMLCAGYKEGGKDACLGDSGGPLACQVGGVEGPWILYGITSWGIGCGDPLHPGVYARVTKKRSLNFILELYFYRLTLRRPIGNIDWFSRLFGKIIFIEILNKCFKPLLLFSETFNSL